MEKKDRYSFAYDPVAALRNCPELLGMELRESGSQLVGGYYLDGSKHPYRRDKLKCFIWKGKVFVQEEGGQCLSLENWLQQYGGCADYKEAIRAIKGENQAIQWNREFRQMVRPEVKYISPDVVAGLKAYDLRKCNLFNWMCTMFPEDRVREVWDKYNCCTDSHGNAVFLYTDQRGRVLFDKRIFYRPDGHRDKSYFPPRQFRVADGYSGRCYYGVNAIEDNGTVYVCESEKSCLLIVLCYGRQAVATGGKGNLREIDNRMKLLPDMDARDTWIEKSSPEQVWEWWKKWPAGIPIPEKADIGDMIVAKKSLSLQKL